MRWMQQVRIRLREAPRVLMRWAGRSADHELRASEERFALAVLGAKDGIWDRDLATGLVYLSPRAQEISMGRPSDGVDLRHEAEWRKWHQIHPEDAPRRAAAMREHLKGRTPQWEGEWRVRHQDGSYHWVHARGICTRDASGRAVRFAGSATDIDARKQAEQALRLSEERYALAMQASGEGHWDWKIASDEYYTSPRHLEIAGFPPGTKFSGRAEVVARVPFHPEDRPRYEAAVAAHFAGETPRVDIEMRLVRPNELRWVRLLGICLRDATGTPVRWAGSVSDITEQKRAQEELKRLEQQLRQAQRLEALGTMAGGIAHDFNNILAAMLGYGEMARPDVPAGTRLHRDLENIMIAGERGRALVERILAFSRSGVGQRVPAHVAADACGGLELLFPQLPPKLRFELA